MIRREAASASIRIKDGRESEITAACYPSMGARTHPGRSGMPR